MKPEAQLEQVIAEYLQAIESGQPVDRKQLLDDHQEIASELEQFFDDHDEIQSMSFECETGNAPFDELTQPPRSASSVDESTTLHRDGIQFGNYRIIEEIARGGMGVVYRAKHLKLNRIVALKMIQSGRAASELEVDRFLTEAGSVACLSHPGIVPLYEFGELDGWHFYTMEFIDGENLASVMEKESPNINRAVDIVVQLAEAIAHAHTNGIVHRDLKPSNVLIDRSGKAHLTDFGLAKRLNQNDELTTPGEILGTASYMPPEQAAGRVDVDEHADIYSIGAILYCLMTGRPPFQADNQLDQLLRVIEGEPAPPRKLRPTISSELNQICMKCLQKSPSDRYNTAQELVDDLKRFQIGEPVTVAPPKLWSRCRRWMRLKPALSVHVLGLGVIEIVRQARYLGTSLKNSEWLSYHLSFTAIFAVWLFLAFMLQWTIDRSRRGLLSSYLWVLLDVVMATIALFISEGQITMLLICLPLIIAGAGTFTRVGVVVFATVACMASFILLAFFRPEMQTDEVYAPLCFAFLGVFGALISFQVHRLRLISRRLGD